jgi:hypothetical protein
MTQLEYELRSMIEMNGNGIPLRRKFDCIVSIDEDSCSNEIIASSEEEKCHQNKQSTTPEQYHVTYLVPYNKPQ